MLSRLPALTVIAFTATALLGAGYFEAAQLQPARSIAAGGTNADVKAVVTALALSPEGAWLVSAGDDHVVRLWDLRDDTQAAELTGHTDWVRAAAFHPDGKHFATAGNDGVIRVWNLASKKIVRKFPAHPQAIYALAYAPNGQWLAAAGYERTIRIYSAEGRPLRTLTGPSDDNRALAIGPDSSTLAVGGRNGQVRVWNAVSGAMLRDLATEKRRLRALAFSPDGELLAAAGDSQNIYLWSAQENEPRLLATTAGQTHALAFCDTDKLATGDTDNHVHVWNVDSLVELRRGAGHTGSVSALVYDATRDTLISGSYDTTIKFWPRTPGESAASRQAEATRTER